MSYPNITITTNTDCAFVVGQFVQLINSLNDYIFGQVISYNSSTGEMVLAPTQSVGSGYFDTWEVVASGNVGASSLFLGTSDTSLTLPFAFITTSTTTTTTTPQPATTTTTTTSSTTTSTTQPVNAVVTFNATGTTILGDAVILIDIALTNNVTFDTTFSVFVTTSNYGVLQYLPQITSGTSFINSINSQGLGSAPIVTSYCIQSCDNPSIDFIGYNC